MSCLAPTFRSGRPTSPELSASQSAKLLGKSAAWRWHHSRPWAGSVRVFVPNHHHLLSSAMASLARLRPRLPRKFVRRTPALACHAQNFGLPVKTDAHFNAARWREVAANLCGYDYTRRGCLTLKSIHCQAPRGVVPVVPHRDALARRRGHEGGTTRDVQNYERDAANGDGCGRSLQAEAHSRFLSFGYRPGASWRQCARMNTD